MRIVLVLGMHRSGTSVVARGLQCLGVSLGDRLMVPQPDNPKGFFEDQDLVDIDDAVLQQLGAAWDDPPPFCEKTLGAIAAGRLGATARQSLSSKVSAGTPFAFKDPRLSVLLPFWAPVFQSLQLEVSYAVVLRNPLSVAASLRQRNAISEDRAMYLWLRYMLATATEVEPGWPSVFAEYDAVIAHPQAELEKIGRALNLDVEPAAVDTFARTFVDEQMRHERDEGERPTAYACLVWPTYQLLRDAARGSGQLSAAQLAQLAAYRSAFEAAMDRDDAAAHGTGKGRWVPRSGSERFYGLVWLPRLIDKARRVAASGNSYLIDHEYMFGENDFADGRVLRFLGLSSSDVLDAVRAERKDVLAAARIVAMSGKTPQECERFSRRFKLVMGPFLPMTDVDEGRKPPGPLTGLVRGFYNAVLVRGAVAVFRRSERARLRDQPPSD
ncbi:MAG: DUF5069 domain-containing protein [Candidatus Cybelea sp.]